MSNGSIPGKLRTTSQISAAQLYGSMLFTKEMVSIFRAPSDSR